MKLSEYAARNDITYRAAWIRYKNGKIPGAYKDDSGTIHVPGRKEELSQKAVLYSRVSTHGQKANLILKVVKIENITLLPGITS